MALALLGLEIDETLQVALAVGFLVGLFCAYLGLCLWMATRAASRPTAGLAPVPGAADAGEPPFSWLVPAVVALVFLFTPFAIASLVHASRVAPLHRAGAFEAAREAARSAKRWFWSSSAVGLTLLLASLSPLVLAVIVD
jgi:hypothetical protein